ncbi:hypothetical protein BSLG_002671 [Batrachochytrium salamandrivorans]|nr:hypothetical protein BSLG_002671 [Batrachochytrium salamandrivorans]
MAAIASSFWGLLDKYAEMRKSLGLPSPGNYESLHREVRGVLPTVFMIDGARFELHSHHNQSFQTGHTLSRGEVALVGQVDHDGSVSARGQYNWIPLPSPPQPSLHDAANSMDPAPTPVLPEMPKVTSTSKFQALFGAQPANNMVQLEHDHHDLDWSLNAKCVNANLIDAQPSWSKSHKNSGATSVTGTYTLSYLQSLSTSIALGAELTYQRATPDLEEPSMAFAMRYAPPPSELPTPLAIPAGTPSPFMPVNPKDPTQVFTTTWMPNVGVLNATYWRRINQRLEVGSELQLLMTPALSRGGQAAATPGRREGMAAVGFKVDTVFTTIRAMLSSHGQVSAVLEEKIAPGISLQLCGEIDYARGSAGRVGFGFTFEA